MSVKKSIVCCLLASVASGTRLTQQLNSLNLNTSEEELEQLTNGRYYNSQDENIDLAQSKNHARMVLDRAPRSLLAQSAKVDPCVKSQESADRICLKQHNDRDAAYMSTIYVGTPPQKMRALFDTGSSNTWVLNKAALGKGGARGKYSYDDTASSTARRTNQAAHITFGSGSLSGHFYQDTFTVGAPGQARLQVKHQQFGNVEQQKTIFNGGFEVLVGMAYPALAEKGTTPLFDNMMKQDLLQSNMFAFYLTTKKDGVESDITFGYYDTSKFSGKIQWHPIMFKYMFGLQLDDILVGGKSIGLCGPNGTFSKKCLVTVDSGTTEIAFPAKIYSQLPGLGIPTQNTGIACQGIESIGELTWVINGTPYSIDAKDWVTFSAADETSELAQIKAEARQQRRQRNLEVVQLGQGSQCMAQELDFADFGSSMGSPFSDSQESANLVPVQVDNKQIASKCYGDMMKMQLRRDMFLVGDVFMRKYYSIFDRGNDRVGLALAV